MIKPISTNTQNLYFQGLRKQTRKQAPNKEKIGFFDRFIKSEKKSKPEKKKRYRQKIKEYLNPDGSLKAKDVITKIGKNIEIFEAYRGDNTLSARYITDTTREIELLETYDIEGNLNERDLYDISKDKANKNIRRHDLIIHESVLPNGIVLNRVTFTKDATIEEYFDINGNLTNKTIIIQTPEGTVKKLCD